LISSKFYGNFDLEKLTVVDLFLLNSDNVIGMLLISYLISFITDTYFTCSSALSKKFSKGPLDVKASSTVQKSWEDQ